MSLVSWCKQGIQSLTFCYKLHMTTMIDLCDDTRIYQCVIELVEALENLYMQGPKVRTSRASKIKCEATCRYIVLYICKFYILQRRFTLYSRKCDSILEYFGGNIKIQIVCFDILYKISCMRMLSLHISLCLISKI